MKLNTIYKRLAFMTVVPVVKIFSIERLSLFCLSIVIQVVIFRQSLNNDVLNDYAPSSLDARSYSNLASTWSSEGFDTAFSDLWRLPGYPFILLLMQTLFPFAPYLATRLFQLIAVSISVVIFNRILREYTSSRVALFFSILYSLLPSWYFVPVLIAESLTACLVVLLMYLMTKVSGNNSHIKYIIYISLLIAILTLLKPNNLLLLAVVSVYMIIRLKKNSIIAISLLVISTFILLLPWIVYTQNQEKAFFGLTTVQGVNFYIGTGMLISYDNSVLANSAIERKVDAKQNPKDVVVLKADIPRIDQNKIYLERALQIWKERPFNQLKFSLDKILIAFGFKVNSNLDYLFGFFNLAALITGFLLIKDNRFRAWGITSIFVAFLLASQSAIFQADRRFIITIFLPFSVLLFAMLASQITNRFGRT
jgi:hypothetical protein